MQVWVDSWKNFIKLSQPGCSWHSVCVIQLLASFSDANFKYDADYMIPSRINDLLPPPLGWLLKTPAVACTRAAR